MLVKIGRMWIDPAQVVYIMPLSTNIAVSVKEDGYCGGITIASAESQEEAEIISDKFAAIINSAGQSFGGEDVLTQEV